MRSSCSPAANAPPGRSKGDTAATRPVICGVRATRLRTVMVPVTLTDSVVDRGSGRTTDTSGLAVVSAIIVKSGCSDESGPRAKMSAARINTTTTRICNDPVNARRRGTSRPSTASSPDDASSPATGSLPRNRLGNFMAR